MSLQSRLAALITAIGADIKSLQNQINAIPGGANPTTYYNTFLQQDLTSTSANSITSLSMVPLATGRYKCKAFIVWRSSTATVGAGFFPTTDAAASLNVGVAYSVTTGTTATSGIVDGQTVAGTFQTMEGRSWRGGVDPQTFGGVDTINSDVVTILDFVLINTVAQNLHILGKAEAAGTISIMPGSYLELTKIM